ncbi:hypothetical protein [Burkholderia glumae]|uniref:Uncharacterized protein n=3 Tax=Burkholderia glumae TaxID=337 RepID=A0ABY5BE53_BURGL|nr:hypothetical protein [Burkholderia glumae]MCM2480317.1 hypothetical protein [Burkholderia glumae]MCM2506716.1 hypothetical protein [Burkholderia glumae]MCM2538387.1 hypothetical protein [Burkholderia glumae]MCM2547979.1 hypothetical protein [Burkholderia glumae]MCQ0033639.1 hypothetical protein [Burkholderia glumae]
MTMDPYDSAEQADFATRPDYEGNEGNEVEIDDMGTVRRTGQGYVDEILVAALEADYGSDGPAYGRLGEAETGEPHGDAGLSA